MSYFPDSANAPNVVGVTPPDSTQQTLEEKLNDILDYLRNGLENDSLTPDDMMALRAFEEAKQSMIQTALGQQEGAPGDPEASDPNGPISDLNGPAVPYGAGADDSPMPPRVGE